MIQNHAKFNTKLIPIFWTIVNINLKQSFGMCRVKGFCNVMYLYLAISNFRCNLYQCKGDHHYCLEVPLEDMDTAMEVSQGEETKCQIRYNLIMTEEGRWLSNAWNWKKCSCLKGKLFYQVYYIFFCSHLSWVWVEYNTFLVCCIYIKKVYKYKGK
jgi:hypothetical protein